MEESYKYNNVSFIIKRNPRQESKEEWLGSVRECCQNIQHPRDGKAVYIGQTFRDVTYSLSDNDEKTVGIRTIYEIMERTIDRYGQHFQNLVYNNKYDGLFRTRLQSQGVPVVL